MKFRIAAALLAALLVCLGIVAAVRGYQVRRNSEAARFQQVVPVELHIAGVSTRQTYTVRARFNVHGRQYVSPPLQIRFKRVQPVYRLKLYYDAKNPAISSWTPFDQPQGLTLHSLFNLSAGPGDGQKPH